MKIIYCILKIIKVYIINKFKKSIFLTFLFYILIFSFIKKTNKKFICLCVIGKKENIYHIKCQSNKISKQYYKMKDF